MAETVRFGAFEVDLSSGELRKRGTKIGLRDKSFRVLVSLLEHPGEVVTRDELQRRLWPEEVFVDFENNLNTTVGRLREALGDSVEHPRFIETLPKRGYRFVAPVQSAIGRPEVRPSRKARIVVLPFLNLSGDPAQEYFSDAMTDEIITAIAPVAPEQLAVIARTTSMHYKGSDKDVARIGRELGVDYAVEGAVRRANGDVEINVQLIRVIDQSHVFARKYGIDWRDLGALHARVAADLAEHIGITTAREKRVATTSGANKPTHDITAYSEYMQGKLQNLGTLEGYSAARQHYENAIARDPGFAQAHDALADLYWELGYLGITSPRKAFSTGIAHALRALEIDNKRAETHALLAQFHKTIGYNWPEVHREMAIARELDPNSPLVRFRYAVSELMPHGQLQQAITELEQVVELDPLSVWAHGWLGIVLVLNRQSERAAEEAHKILEINPNSGPGHFILGLAYRYLRRCEEAIAAQRRAVELSGGAPSFLGWLGLTLATCGERAEAREILGRLDQMKASAYVPPTSFAWIYLSLGDIDRGFEWMDRAVDEADQFMLPIKSYGFFDPLRSDPRFVALLRKMKLEN